MFQRQYVITLHRVRDNPTFTNGEKRLTLNVDGDPHGMAAALLVSRNVLKQITEESPENDIQAAALIHAAAMFGKEQAEQLIDFCGHPINAINICNKYFSNRLVMLIDKELRAKGRDHNAE